MMLFPSSARVFLAAEATDMRRGFNGLCAAVEGQFGHVVREAWRAVRRQQERDRKVLEERRLTRRERTRLQDAVNDAWPKAGEVAPPPKPSGVVDTLVADALRAWLRARRERSLRPLRATTRLGTAQPPAAALWTVTRLGTAQLPPSPLDNAKRCPH